MLHCSQSKKHNKQEQQLDATIIIKQSISTSRGVLVTQALLILFPRKLVCCSSYDMCKLVDRSADSLLLLCQKAPTCILAYNADSHNSSQKFLILLCNALLTVGNDCPKCKAGKTDEASGAICRHGTPRYPPIILS